MKLSKRIFAWVLAGAMMMGVAATATAQSYRSSSGSYMGKVESDGTIRNSSNSYVGKIERDGTIRNSSNSYVGKIESDGTVRDASNRNVGSARGIDRKYAAVIFFFDLL